MSQTDAINLLWRANVLLQAVLCAKILATGLWRLYRRFTAYLVGLTAESIILAAVLAHHVGLYSKVWVATRSVLILLQILAVSEIFSRWAESHRNIGTFGQRLFAILGALAMGFAIATVPVSGSAKQWDWIIYATTVANRAAQFGVGAFMILMLGFFAKFGGPVAPNLRRHAWAMSAFSLANTISYFLLTSRVVVFGNIVLQVVPAGALIFWIYGLKRTGEEPPKEEYDPRVGAEAEETNRQMLEFAETVRQQRERGRP